MNTKTKNNPIYKIYLRKVIGKLGELAVATHLKNKGHVILCMNNLLKQGEIDILSLKNDILFVNEVKTTVVTYSKNPYIEPEDSFSRLKISKLKKLAKAIYQGFDTNEGVLRLNRKESFTSNGTSLGSINGVQVCGFAVRLLLEESDHVVFKEEFSATHTPDDTLKRNLLLKLKSKIKTIKIRTYDISL